MSEQAKRDNEEHKELEQASKMVQDFQVQLTARLRQLREEHGLLQKELAEKLNVTPEAISQWETGRREPSNRMRKVIANFFKVPEASLMGGFHWLESSAALPPATSVIRVEADRTTIPQLGTAPASPKRWVADEVERWVDFPKEIVRGRRMYLLAVMGDSMNRAGIDDGDTVLVDADAQPKNGDIVVIRVDSEYTIKHFYRTEHEITLVPDSTNAEHKPLVVGRKSDVQVRGVVEAIYLKRLR